MFLEAGVDKTKTNGLVRALFDDGRCEALVGATYTSVCVMCNCIVLQAVH